MLDDQLFLQPRPYVTVNSLIQVIKSPCVPDDYNTESYK